MPPDYVSILGNTIDALDEALQDGRPHSGACECEHCNLYDSVDLALQKLRVAVLA